jgi:hypothetical protein
VPLNVSAQQSLPTPVKDLSESLTVFVLTVGDQPNLSECEEALKRQTVAFRLEAIQNVAPLSAAMQQMLNRCETPYFVQVDEDMTLYKEAIGILYRRICEAPPEVALVCAPLWDSYMQMPLNGVKAYRHSIVRNFPYRQTFSSEWVQVLELLQHGYKIAMAPHERRCCLGEHGHHFTPRSIFVRFQRLAQKDRKYRHIRWLKPWASQLVRRTIRDDASELDRFALLGLVAGLTGCMPPDREWDFRDEVSDLARLKEYFLY